MIQSQSFTAMRWFSSHSVLQCKALLLCCHLHIKVCALSSVYSPAASHSATKSYVSELHAIAKMTGKSFELVLQNELAKLSSVTVTSAESVPVGGDDVGSVLPLLSAIQLSFSPTSTIESPMPTSKVPTSVYASISEQNLTRATISQITNDCQSMCTLNC